MDAVALVGLVVFTVGLAAVIFPAIVADALNGVVGRDGGRAGEVGVRAVGFLLGIVGFLLIVR